MTGEQKGRSGKKPKYHIADIGGADLTSQDISTERVLNFLIKGEIGSAGQPSPVSSAEADEAISESLLASSPSPSVPDNSPITSLPSSETRGSKSLAHLFERASSAPSQTSKAILASQEQPIPFSQAAEAEISLPGKLAPNSQESMGVVETAEQHLTANDFVQVAPASSQTQNASLPKSLINASVDTKANKLPLVDNSQQDTDLTQLKTLWKILYRLNTGEIDALSAIYRMSNGQGSSECYIKMQKLAEMSGLTYRYCQKVVRSLEQAGWITKLKDYDATNQLGVLYRFNVKPSTDLP